MKLSWTPKAHQIADHFSDYFDDPLVCGQSLGVTTDQVIEHMHSYVNRMLTRSMYLKFFTPNLGLNVINRWYPFNVTWQTNSAPLERIT